MATQNLGAENITTPTSTARDPWQEALSKWQTVPAAKVEQAAEVIRGLAGSWAASHQFDVGVRDNNRSSDAATPTPQQFKVSKIGQPGYPEINFAPYNFGTNRFGSKGGSFVGHPISFSVIGPTAKYGANDPWQWVYSTGAGGDVLTLDVRETVYTLNDLYGLDSIANYPGGLYIVISLTGSNATIKGVPGGVGDGTLLDSTNTGNNEGITPIGENSKFEIFRVVSFRNGEIHLDPAKRLSTFFTIPGGGKVPVVRSVTFIQPQATRLVAVPGSGTNVDTPQAFAVVPPRRGLGTDERYPYNVWTGAPWNELNLDSYQLGTGSEHTYKLGPQLPIPRPLGTWNGRLRGISPATGLAEAPVVTPAGTFILHNAPTFGYAEDLLGKILHVQSISVNGNAVLQADSTTDYRAPTSALLGWFEVVDRVGPAYPAQPTYWVLRRVEENNPSTGFSVTGANGYYTVSSTAPSIHKGIYVEATVHEPVSSLWGTNYGDIDKIQSARLTNIIDPRWVERSYKNGGLDSARADRAVFNTAGTGAANENANPGSLLDLGFRMVLFPAKVGTELAPGGGTVSILIPDWANPITSNEILLDPAKSGKERQYVEVDYANGLVRFSHAIKDGSPLYPSDPAVFTTDNPRGEMVLFACCVPYSMEEGQLGSNVRTSGGTPNQNDIGFCGDTPPTLNTVDVFSDRLCIPCDLGTVFLPVTQDINSVHVLTPAALQTLVLDGNWANKIPSSGYFELVTAGNGPDGNPALTVGNLNHRVSLYSYEYMDLSFDTFGKPKTTLYHIAGGGQTGVDTVTSDSDFPKLAVFRREIVTPNDDTGVAGVPYQFDTTYGSAKRASALRFDDADVVPNLDGSVTVRSKGTQTQNLQKNFDDMFSSWVLKTGRINATGVGPFNVGVSSHTILMHGQRMVMPPVTVQIPGGDNTYYLYYEHTDGVDCPKCLYIPIFPLLDPEDVLLAKLEIVGTSITVTPLQAPLQDLDRRLDIYVGEIGYGGLSSSFLPGWLNYAPHFTTLWQAVEYANEMMSSFGGGSGGGGCLQHIRIMVIGRTYEPDDKLPIQIKTSGLVIEGAPHYDSDPTHGIVDYGGPFEISWGTDPYQKNLIDLNGYNSLVFRNLSFRSLAPTALDFATGTACVFTNSTGTPYGITIDNCRGVGYIKNFVDFSTGGAQGSQITNNIVADITGGGVVCLSGAAAIINVLIQGNIFTGEPGRVSSAACIDLHTSTNALTTFMDAIQLNSGVLVQGNTIQDFPIGIWAIAQSGSIANNVITNTENEGIVTAGGWEIRNNHLTNIYQSNVLAGHFDEGMDVASRHGIRHYTNYRVSSLDAVFSGHIQNNRVELSFASAQKDDTLDKGILVTGSANLLSSKINLRADTCTALGGADTFTLDVGASTVNDFYVGGRVSFTNNSPAGVGTEVRTITAYDGGTKVATVGVVWTTVPDVTSDFRIDRGIRSTDEIVEGNHTGYSTGLVSQTDLCNIHVDGINAKVSGNVCRALEVWGTSNTVRDNKSQYLGVNWGVLAIAHNPDLDSTETNSVAGNTVGNDSYLWSGTTALGNTFSNSTDTGKTHVRHNCALQSNNVFELSDFDGIGLETGDSQNLSLIGNNITQFTASTLNLSAFTITGNQITGALIIPKLSMGVFGDNKLGGALTLGTSASTYGTVSGNIVAGTLTIGAVAHHSYDIAVTGNRLTELVAFAEDSTFSGNITGGFTVTGSVNDINANNTTTTLVTGNNNNVTGNNTTNLTVEGATNVIQGNRVLGDLTLTAGVLNTYNVVANNSADPTANTLYVNTNYTVMTGNIFKDIVFGDDLTNAVLTGNMLGGDINLGSSAAHQVDPVVIVGNMVGGATGISAHAAKPATPSAIVVGNAAQAIFTVAPAAANVNANNGDV